ncbi:MAG: hypothetical protein JWP01_3007 [Myxococcales bacterium]|nr:hypothetical protein [Myxococcales bacterium]
MTVVTSRTLALLLVAAATSLAGAEPRKKPAQPKPTEPAFKVTSKVPGVISKRVYGANANRLGCNPYVSLNCEGIERWRLGQAASHGALTSKKTGRGPVAMFQASSQPRDGELASQTIGAIGVKQMIGTAWIMAGAGVAATRDHGRGPKPISVTEALGAPRPAVAGGIGVDIDSKFDEPTSFALDLGGTIDSDERGPIYQWSASLVQRF